MTDSSCQVMWFKFCEADYKAGFKSSIRCSTFCTLLLICVVKRNRAEVTLKPIDSV